MHPTHTSRHDLHFLRTEARKPNPFLLFGTSPISTPRKPPQMYANLWSRLSLLSTGRVPHRRFLRLSRASRSPTSVSHCPFALLCQFRPTHYCIPDIIFAYARIRKVVTVPREGETDFRAACFCHKRVVDVRYVCLVCVSGLVHPIALSLYPC